MNNESTTQSNCHNPLPNMNARTRMLLFSIVAIVIGGIVIFEKGWDIYYRARLMVANQWESDNTVLPASGWIESKYLENGIQIGVVSLGDKTKVKFAFISHHMTMNRKSYTLFESTGIDILFVGWFCCDVSEHDFKTQPLTYNDLKAFLKSHDGIQP